MSMTELSTAPGGDVNPAPQGMNYDDIELDVVDAYCAVLCGQGRPSGVTRDAWEEATLEAAPDVIAYLKTRGLVVRSDDSPQDAATRFFVTTARRRLIDERRKIERRRRRMDELGLPLL